MTAIERAARVSALLDEAKECWDPNMVNTHGVAWASIRCQSKITEAQNVLMGEPPSQPENN
jgi:hypothetical protein